MTEVPTSEELLRRLEKLDSLERLYEKLYSTLTRTADAMLEQAAAINKLLPPFERIKSDIFTLLNNHDLDRASLDLRLRDIDRNLALLVDNVKDVQRDVTNPHLRLPPEETKAGAIVKVIEAAERTSLTTKIFIAVIVALIAIGGYLGLALHMAKDAGH